MQDRPDKRGKAKILIIALLAVFLAVLAGGGIFLKIMHDSDTFFAGTTVNGYTVDGLSPEAVYDILVETYRGAFVEIDEKGQTEAQGTLADFGYAVEEDKLMRLVQKAKDAQRSSFDTLFMSLLQGNSFIIEVPFIVDEQRLSEAASRQALADARYSSEDAYLSFDAGSRTYSIVPEVYGNDFSDDSLKGLVREAIDSFTKERQAGNVVKVDIPEDIYYKPAVLSTDQSLTEQYTVYNEFCGAEVDYQFGSQTETLGWDTIRDWIIISGGNGIIDEDKVLEYVRSLEERYNTRYHTRYFHTSVGTDIEFPDSLNEYGYTINEDAEVSRLLEDLYSNSVVSREPVYYTVAGEYENPVFYAREGTDDLAGSYVEVNLTAQHLWFYKHGSLVIESDIVSGCVARGTETQTGVFPLAYKESPSVLTGGNAENGYSTPVQYWMPFYEGQGLHDANWRGAFGGSIYVNSGSHGCVNLPPAVAGAIYSEIEPGMAILIYR
ncbi:MAG: L,D-transpeptidase family protein [Blautia sp.]|nr:L,D-transpeptidase family protein [Blautia sp.]